MTWRTLAISFAIGAATDIALVWLFYWWNEEPYSWAGFWIWQAVLIAAGLLLWLRKLLGFMVWYFVFGREAVAAEAFQKYIEFQFKPIETDWDSVENWLTGHTQGGQSSAATELLVGLALMRQAGLWQYFLLSSAYKKAAIRYSKYAARKGML